MLEHPSFIREYEKVVSGNDRIYIPSYLANQIRTRNPDREKIVLMVVPYIENDEKCLICYDPLGWKDEGEKLFSTAEKKEVKIWGNRIKIPPDFKKLDIGRLITLIGVANRFEIWDRGKWEEYKLKVDYEGVAEKLSIK